MRPTLLVAALSCAALACQPAPAALSEADIAALRADLARFAQDAVARRDSATAAQYTEDAVFMVPNQPAVEGRAAIRAWFEGFPPLTEFSLNVADVDGRGDLAYVRGTYTLTIAASDRTPAISDRGKFLEIRRKQPDGQWLLTLDIFNSDVPLPTR